MTDLTLKNINTYLETNPASDVCTSSLVTGVTNSKITDIDAFLMNKINALYDPSSTRKDNFLTLYNEQYVRNLEVMVGILFISGVLAKMMFYPTII